MLQGSWGEQTMDPMQVEEGLALAQGGAGEGCVPVALGWERGWEPACSLEPSFVGQGSPPMAAPDQAHSWSSPARRA